MGRGDFKYLEADDVCFRSSKGKIKSAPPLPEAAHVADTHCHLNMLANPAYALARAAAHGVGFICCMTDPAERPQESEEDCALVSARGAYEAHDLWLGQARELLDTWGMQGTLLPHIRYAVGVHPHNAKHWIDAKVVMEDLLARPETSCLGEIGLDYHYDLSPRDTQRDVFAQQLHIANEMGVPVSLHLREAHDDAVKILLREGIPRAGCIVHCFNLGREELKPFLDLGCFIALGGPLTFRKSWYTRRAVLDIPVDRLLTETDAPYMAPEPLRGTVCMPDQTVFTLRMLMDCFGYSGQARMQELVSPRQVDLGQDVALDDICTMDPLVLQNGMDETQFAERVYNNAIGLLDGKRG